MKPNLTYGAQSTVKRHAGKLGCSTTRATFPPCARVFSLTHAGSLAGCQSWYRTTACNGRNLPIVAGTRSRAGALYLRLALQVQRIKIYHSLIDSINCPRSTLRTFKSFEGPCSTFSFRACHRLLIAHTRQSSPEIEPTIAARLAMALSRSSAMCLLL